MKSYKSKIVLIVGCITLFTGCANIPMETTKAVLNASSTQVTLSTESPAQGCKRLELVTYSYFKGTFFSCDFEDAQNTMKNKAASLGGNYVKLLGINDAGVRCQGTGEAYVCPMK